MIVDPAKKFAKIKSIKILPKCANRFLAEKKSSATHKNDTFVLHIKQNDEDEKTGNVTILAELAAFNRNHSTYTSYSHEVQRAMWRWRIAFYAFNLTIGHKNKMED